MIDKLGSQIDISGRLFQHTAGAIDGVAIERNPIAIHEINIEGDLMRLCER